MTMYDFLKTLTTKTLERLSDELTMDMKIFRREDRDFEMWAKSISTKVEIGVILHSRAHVQHAMDDEDGK